MEAALGAANWVLAKLLNKLSDDLVAAYVASSELGLNAKQIKADLLYTQGLLHEAQGRAVDGNPGLQGLLQQLSKKADEAEDALDELHYFILRDQLLGTQEAAPEVRRGHALHGRHAARHTAGNWLPCFSCSHMRRDGDCDATAGDDNPHHATKATTDNGVDCGRDGMLPFNRVDMSNKIKSLIQTIQSLCSRVSNLLKINHRISIATLKRPATASTITGHHKLYGRSAILGKTLNEMICGSYHSESMSVLPIVGPGGIGKTTFAKYLYNDEKTKAHFPIRVWICVSINFDVINLSQEILKCIPEAESKDSTNLDQLQNSIAEALKSKRFLIVLDDIWKCNSKHEWENLLAPFRKGGNEGNMVLVTTRFPSIVEMVKTTDAIELQGLEPNDFFALFETYIFPGKDKPKHYKDELMGTARKIAKKLKGSPLAANTVGRLLKKDLSHEHWMKVLENNEWQYQENGDDIMPSLKISYDYLPFNLQKCFSYCALFPVDYRFHNLEITCFWIAVGIIDSSAQEDKNYLEKLVDNGFLIKEGQESNQYYVMHDLLHELARHVSSQEIFNISSFSFRAHAIPTSIRHLSITIHDEFDMNFEGEMGKLKRMIDIANLRTLIITRKYEERVSSVVKDMFKETKCLRVLFFVMDSPECLPHNFSRLIHLRYLKIKSPYGLGMSLPSTLSRFYHLQFLDLEDWYGRSSLPKEISHLVNLRYFFSRSAFHANVPMVGKMKSLRELKQFCVKKETVGFELRELGELTQLGGELCICNLEKVANKEEAKCANLMLKGNLRELTLVWGTEQQTTGADVLDGLQPHRNLRSLKIINHGGATGPSWLCDATYVNNIKILHLDGLSWCTLPPFGRLLHLTRLKLKNISGVHRLGPDFGGVVEKSFTHLKEIVFECMPELEEWVWGAKLNLFSGLQRLTCIDCPNLRALRFSEYSGHCTQDINTVWFPNLCHLYIDECPKLSRPPCLILPQTDFIVKENGHVRLSHSKNNLNISRYDGAMAFHNMDKVEYMTIGDVSRVSLSDLQVLKSLTRLTINSYYSMFFRKMDDVVVLHSIQSLTLWRFHLTVQSLQKVFKCFPALSKLSISSRPSSGDYEDVVLQIPSSSSLRELWLHNCKTLVLLPMEDGGGLQDLTSLQSLTIEDCGNIFSQWSVGVAQNTPSFPSSLRELHIRRESSLKSMAPLSNLTSLTNLTLTGCHSLLIDGFNPFITVNLKILDVVNGRGEKNPCSIAVDIFSDVARTKMIRDAGSFQLEQLYVDSISAVLVPPICRRLSPTLLVLSFKYDHRAEGFTEEQVQALKLLTSLQQLRFFCCDSLQSLPEGLCHLCSLQVLTVINCPKIRSLPNEGLPTSLRTLTAILVDSADLKDQMKRLKETHPHLTVYN